MQHITHDSFTNRGSSCGRHSPCDTQILPKTWFSPMTTTTCLIGVIVARHSAPAPPSHASAGSRRCPLQPQVYCPPCCEDRARDGGSCCGYESRSCCGYESRDLSRRVLRLDSDSADHAWLCPPRGLWPTPGLRPAYARPTPGLRRALRGPAGARGAPRGAYAARRASSAAIWMIWSSWPPTSRWRPHSKRISAPETP
jgi:hypothetical protein